MQIVIQGGFWWSIKEFVVFLWVVSEWGGLIVVTVLGWLDRQLI